MLAVNDAFFQTETLAYIIAAIAFLAGAHLLLSTFRRLFRRRIQLPKGAGAERLDVVKIAALDPQRQLVVIRRDGVEHLVEIGGPNDLVIETYFSGSGAGFDEIEANSPSEEALEQVRFRRLRSYIQLAAGIFAGPGLFPLAVVSGIGGAGAGLICGLFRLALDKADRFRVSLPAWWQDQPLLGSSL